MTMERNVEIKTHQSPFPQKGEGKSFKCKIWLQFQSSAIQNNRVANKPQNRNHLFPQYLIPLFPSQKPAFTLAEGATHVDMYGNTRRCAFTMAEVLITLGIIGIVAAMTLPAPVSYTHLNFDLPAGIWFESGVSSSDSAYIIVHVDFYIFIEFFNHKH